MLYDGALRFIRAAEYGFEEEQTFRSNEIINYNLLRAHQIIVELRACLDLSVEGDFAKTMYLLYTYMEELMSEANVKKQVQPLREAKKHLLEIREAWAQMLEQQETPDLPTTRMSCSA